MESEPIRQPNKGRYKRRDIPHWDFANAKQHITFRLSDSLTLNQLEVLKRQAEENPESRRSYYLHLSIEEWINRGMGTCILNIPEFAQVVVNALQQLHNKRYYLYHWVVMPNHVHVLIREFPHSPICNVVNSWKHFTSVQFDELLRKFKNSSRFQNSYIDSLIKTFNGHYWITDYWDVMIRNKKHFDLEVNYIAQNPVKAGLVQRPEDFPWSSFYKSPRIIE